MKEKINLGTNLIILLILLALVFLAVASLYNSYSIRELARIVELDILCMQEATNQLMEIWNVIKRLYSETELEMAEYKIISRIVESAEGSLG